MSLQTAPDAYGHLAISEPSEKGFEEDTLLSHGDILHPSRKGRVPWRWLLMCILSWTITCVVVALYVWDKVVSNGESYEQGWKTDFITSRQAIEIELKTFTGAPAIAENGTVVVPNKEPIRYVGEPSPEVDQAWEELVGGRYFLISEEEAKVTWGDEYQKYWSDDRGGYVAGLDVFHTLHCLNQIRQKLHPEYYPSHSHAGPEAQLIHNGHCIEQIRQYIMCAGDLTVLGTKYYSGLDRNYVLSDVSHTCRNFESIRDWTWERYNGSTAVKPFYKLGPQST